MGAVTGAPRAVKIPAPAPLFPGIQESFMKDLTSAGVGPASFGTIAETARTGLPTDVGPAFEALKASMQTGIEEGRTNLIEKYGMQGLRHGSDLFAKAAPEFERGVQKDFASILAELTRQSSEAAAGRRLGAAQLGSELISEPALAFRPTAVVASGGGILPQAASLMEALASLGLII